MDRQLKLRKVKSKSIGERVLIHPNGIIRVCALMIGIPYGIGRSYGRKII